MSDRVALNGGSMCDKRMRNRNTRKPFLNWVKPYVHTPDAQSVWKEFQEHMKSSSKGASEKRRLTQYVTNTVLDDNYKGTTEQFVLHFNEHFRQLEEIS